MKANFLLKQSIDCQLKHDLELKNELNLMSGQKENWKQNKSNKKHQRDIMLTLNRLFWL